VANPSASYTYCGRNFESTRARNLLFWRRYTAGRCNDRGSLDIRDPSRTVRSLITAASLSHSRSTLSRQYILFALTIRQPSMVPPRTHVRRNVIRLPF
jgi:hypothetical protein